MGVIEMGWISLALSTWCCRRLRQRGTAAWAGVMIMWHVCQAGTTQAARLISQTGTEAAVAESQRK